MSRAIAIETSGKVGSVAVVQDAQLIDERTFPHGLSNAAGIIPMLDELIRAQGWKPANIEQLYISTGPGSFTGLRIGITLAKTMALATGVKLVAVPSHRVLVENAPPEALHVVIVLDAKRGQIFTARFERIGDKWIEHEPAHLDTLAAMLSRAPRPVYLLGEGIPYHRKFLGGDDARVMITPEDSWRARASAVAKLGIKLATAGQFADPFQLTPIYVRKPEAEEKWEQSHSLGKPG